MEIADISARLRFDLGDALSSLADLGDALQEAQSQASDLGAAGAGMAKDFDGVTTVGQAAVGVLDEMTEALNSSTASLDVVTAGLNDLAGTSGAVTTVGDQVTELGGAMEAAAGGASSFEERVTALEGALQEAASGELSAAEATQSVGQALSDLGIDFDALYEKMIATGGSTAEFEAELRAALEASVAAAGGVTDLEGATGATSDALEDLAEAAAAGTTGEESLADAAGNTKDQLQDAEEVVEQTSSSFEVLADKMLSLAEALAVTEGMREFAESALEAADRVDDATSAIGMLGGGAEEAETSVAQLRDVAMDEGLSFPQILVASQRMTAFLGSSVEVPGIIEAIGNSSAVMNTSLEASAQKFTQIVSGGDLSARSLRSLGLTLGDVAKELNTTEGNAAKAFKELDQAERINVVKDALGKFDGAAKKLNGDALGEMVRLGQSLEQVMEGVGTALDPVLKQILEFLRTDIVPSLKGIVEAFAALPLPIQTFAISLATGAAALVPLAAGIGGTSLVFSQLQKVIPLATEALEAFGIGQTAVAAETAAANAVIAASGEAATVASAAATGLAGVLGVALVSAAVGVTIAFHELDEAMADARKVYDATNSQFHEFIVNMGTAPKTMAEFTEAQDSLRDAFALGAVDAKLYQDTLKALDETLKKIQAKDAKQAIEEMNAQMLDLGIHVQGVTQKVSLGTAQNLAHKISIDTLRDAVEKAQGKLTALADAYQKTGKGGQDLVEAQKDLEKATKALDAAQKGSAESIKEAKEATAAFAKEQKSAGDFAQKAGEVIAQLPRSYDAYVSSLMNGGKSASSMLGTVNAQLVEAQKLSQSLSGAPAEAIQYWADKLGVAHAALLALHADEVFKKLAEESLKLASDAWKQYEADANASATATAEVLRQVGILGAAAPAMTPAIEAMHQLGIKAEDAMKVVADTSAFDTLARDGTTSIEVVNEAWEKSRASIQKLAETDLPAAVEAYDDYIGALQRAGAPQGRINELLAERLQLEAQVREKAGQSITAQLVGLTNLSVQQQVAHDKVAMIGEAYAGVVNAGIHAFEQLGHGLSDLAVDGGKFKDVMIGVFKDIEKEILDVVIGTVLKALRAEIVDLIGGDFSFKGLGTSIKSGLGGLKGAVDQVSDAAKPAVDGLKAAGDAGKTAAGATSAATSSLMSTVNMVSGIVTAIGSVMGAITNMRQEGTLNAIEANTRFLEIIFQKFAEQDEWQRHNEIQAKWDAIYARMGEMWQSEANGAAGIFARLGDIWGTLQGGAAAAGTSQIIAAIVAAGITVSSTVAAESSTLGSSFTRAIADVTDAVGRGSAGDVAVVQELIGVHGAIRDTTDVFRTVGRSTADALSVVHQTLRDISRGVADGVEAARETGRIITNVNGTMRDVNETVKTVGRGQAEAIIDLHTALGDIARNSADGANAFRELGRQMEGIHGTMRDVGDGVRETGRFINETGLTTHVDLRDVNRSVSAGSEAVGRALNAIGADIAGMYAYAKEAAVDRKGTNQILNRIELLQREGSDRTARAAVELKTSVENAALAAQNLGPSLTTIFDGTTTIADEVKTSGEKITEAVTTSSGVTAAAVSGALASAASITAGAVQQIQSAIAAMGTWGGGAVVPDYTIGTNGEIIPAQHYFDQGSVQMRQSLSSTAQSAFQVGNWEAFSQAIEEFRKYSGGTAPVWWTSDMTKEIVETNKGHYSSLPSYDKGGFVPHDMVAQIHGGEFVIPPNLSAADLLASMDLGSSLSGPGTLGAVPTGNNTISIGSMPITINGYNKDQKQLVRELIREIPNELKRILPGLGAPGG